MRIKDAADYPRWLRAFVSSYEMLYSQPVVYEYPLLTQPVLFLMGANDHNAPGRPFAPEALRPKMGENAKLAQEIPSDDAAALLDNLPEDLSSSVLEMMRPQESGEVENLLEYAEQTAGRIMNPHVFALAEDMTVGEAITELQSNRDVEMVFYLYVVDERRHLVGVVSLRRLLLVSPETPLKRIMTSDVYSARVDTDQEDVARQVASYNLLALPIAYFQSRRVGDSVARYT